MKNNLRMLTYFKTALFIAVSLFITFSANASRQKAAVGKPVYCDTTAGRTVLDNGSYSKLYCRNHAVMNLQTLHGCCSWAGGILTVRNGNVICRNGTLSPICSLQNQNNNDKQKSDGSVSFDEDSL